MKIHIQYSVLVALPNKKLGYWEVLSLWGVTKEVEWMGKVRVGRKGVHAVWLMLDGGESASRVDAVMWKWRWRGECGRT